MGWWVRLAFKMHVPLQRLMRETTSSEFVLLCQALEDELNFHDKLDWYLAAIWAELRRSYSKKPWKVKIKDFLLKFGGKSKDEAEGDWRKQMELSKRAWFRAAGLKPDGSTKEVQVTRKPRSSAVVASKKRVVKHGRNS